MPKIIIHGSTVGSNFGDCLFAELFYKECKKNNKGQTLFYENKLPVKNEVVALSEHFKKAMNYTDKCTFKDVRSCDGMIFMAGGYFGETTTSLKEALLRYYKHVKLGLYAIWFKKPLAIIGVGAGPISHKFLVKGIKKVFNHASVISVRNDESKEFLEKIGVNKKIYVTADAAQIVSKENAQPLDEKTRKEIEKNCGTEKILILHCSLSAAQIKIMEEKIIPGLNKFLDNHKDFGVVLTVDQYSAGRKTELDEIAKKLNTDKTYVYQYENPQKMINLINYADFVITSKLHVGIVSCSLSKPVASFPFNSKKIERYYKQIGESDRCRPIKNVSADEAGEVIERFYDKPVVLSQEILDAAKLNYDLMNKFIRSLDKKEK
ncbi:MAG: polysaccharide pyruvyl transferase family protein [Hominimerdicola sp.]